VAAPKAPLLDASGKQSKDVSLEEAIFGAEIRPHLVHETVRAELNARRSATRGGKSRGLVAGGRSKPWRQKGTGRARQGTIRAPQFTGGGIAFPPNARSFEIKVNRKAKRAAFRSALSDHVAAGTLGLVSPFGAPSAKQAATLLEAWGKETPTVVVVNEGEETIFKSFRNLNGVLTVTADELEVAEVVWARSLLVSEAALPNLVGRAS
jgi:large subunit ribosomal protein L4